MSLNVDTIDTCVGLEDGDQQGDLRANDHSRSRRLGLRVGDGPTFRLETALATAFKVFFAAFLRFLCSRLLAFSEACAARSNRRRCNRTESEVPAGDVAEQLMYVYESETSRCGLPAGDVTLQLSSLTLLASEGGRGGVNNFRRGGAGSGERYLGGVGGSCGECTAASTGGGGGGGGSGAGGGRGNMKAGGRGGSGNWNGGILRPKRLSTI